MRPQAGVAYLGGSLAAVYWLRGARTFPHVMVHVLLLQYDIDVYGLAPCLRYKLLAEKLHVLRNTGFVTLPWEAPR